jgi:DNA topoisomerase-1
MGRFVYQCKQKKYNFDNLSQQDIEALIEDKIQKNIDKVLHNWEDEGFSGESAGTLCNYYKIKIELSKDVDATKLTLEEVQEMIAKKTPAKKVAAKKTPAKKATATKKPAAKKSSCKRNKIFKRP